jgi:25S rRNA (uracil2634-N3)-methyltransferase
MPARGGGGGGGGGGGMIVANDASVFDHVYTNPKVVSCYSSAHSILMVGEGDFAFSLALAVKLGGRKLVATSYDSRATVLEKYPHAITHLTALRTAHVELHHGVDVKSLGREPWMHKFNRIIFNFPHIGGSSEEDVTLNQELLADYFKSAAPFLSKEPKGQAIVALRNTSFYDKWKIQEQAKKAGLILKETRRFPSRDFPTYKPVRTQPMVREAPSHDNALNYIFVEAEEGELSYSSDEEVEEASEEEEAEVGEDYGTANKKEIRKRKRAEERAEKEKKKAKEASLPHQRDDHIMAWRQQQAEDAVVEESDEEEEEEEEEEDDEAKSKRFRIDPTGQQKIIVLLPGWVVEARRPKAKKPKKKKEKPREKERRLWEAKRGKPKKAEKKRQARAKEAAVKLKSEKPQPTGSVPGPDGVEYLIWDD